MALKHILVGVDGSPAGQAAVRWSAALASEVGAEVLVVVVLDSNTELRRDLPPSGLSSWRDHLRTQLRAEWVEPLRTAGVSFSTKLVEGPTAETLIATADAEAVDLIAIGTHGRGGIGSRLLGSVSYALTRRAHQPVTVVPPWTAADPPSASRP